MDEKVTLFKLKKNLKFFNKMYDIVRLVDPVRKRVMEYQDSGMEEVQETCYAYWRSGRICDNCISVRAHREQKSFIKLESSPNVVMLVTALPIEYSEPPVVLELLKNATDTMMIGTGDYNKGDILYNAVQDINNLVIRDELTALYNRRFLDDRLPVDIVNAVVNHKPLSVIFIDIDNMKAVNDSFGHSAGDELLKYAADTIKGCIGSEGNWTARYGGDEFVVCLNNTGSEGALRISERIYHDFAKSSFSVQGSAIAVKVSQGVVTMPGSGLTAEEIIELADKKMYETKKCHKR